MLTLELVKTTYRNKTIYPSYINIEDQHLLDIARTIIMIFQENIGKRREIIQNQLQELIGSSSELLQYKGLAHLIEDKCVFSTDDSINAMELREAVFTLSSQMHAQGTFQKETVLEQIGLKFGISPQKVEESLFLDLKQNEILQSVEEITPEFLLKRYNTALAQAILYKAVSLEITIKEKEIYRYRQLFRAIKFFRLLYSITGTSDDGFQIILDGPMSLFHDSVKYGIQLALFLPALLLCNHWELKAPLSWYKDPKKTAFFYLSSKQKLYSHYANNGMYQPPEIIAFEERFNSLHSEWEINSDCYCLNIGQDICIPDYTFINCKNNTIVYLEIFGFWRKADVSKKLELSEKCKYNLLFAVSKQWNLEASNEELDHKNIYYYRQVLIPKDVLKKLDYFITK